MRKQMPFLMAGALALIVMTTALAENALVQVHQDFSEDPGWEGMNNRVIAENPPTKTQQFGYTPTTRSSSTVGEIGGTMWCTRKPAWYAMPIGKPLSYKDSLSVSGRISLVGIEGPGYIGFFNSQRQDWRPWSALGLRLSDSKRGQALHGKEIRGAQIWVDYMTATWKAGYMVLDSFIPADGSMHTFSLSYDPNARVDMHWSDSRLEAIFKNQERMAEEDIVSAMQKHEPKLTRDLLRPVLETARNQGLLEYDPRHGVNYWELKRDLDKVQGRLTFQLDRDPPQQYYLDPGIRDEPAVMDRFGLFNFQLPEGRTIEFYVSDLTINGQKIDLSRDPHWQEMNNRISFVEHDFHPGQNFGFSQTNWAGAKTGEIGGLFWRNEPNDPYHGFYADDIGELMLDDPISFSGTINFVNGGTDASMMFGFFNRDDQLRELTREQGKTAKPQVLGIQIDDLTSGGYYFTPALNGPGGKADKRGPQFVPDRKRRHFTFEYDPSGNNGVGRITAKLDDTVITLDLKPAMRQAGARFDRFGLMNVRSGGKYVEVYFDDLSYTAKRPPGFKPASYKDKPVKVPYPPHGRMY